MENRITENADCCCLDENQDGLCDVKDGICNGNYDSADLDCDGICNINDGPGPDCNGECDSGDIAGSLDCNGSCWTGDAQDSVDCNGLCEYGDYTDGGLIYGNDCNYVCDPGEPLGPDCDGRCNKKFSDYPFDHIDSIDCDGICDAGNGGDQQGSPDCNGIM